MNKAVLAAAVLLALGAMGAFWFLGKGDVRGASAGDDVAKPLVARPGDKGPAPELEGTTGVPDDPTPDVEVATESAGERRAAEIPDAIPEDEGFLLRIVHGDDELPVPDAEVFAFAGEIPEDEKETAHDYTTMDAWIATHGLRLRADAEGLVRVPHDGENRTLVIARSEGLWGRGTRAPRELDERVPEETRADAAEDAKDPQTFELSVDQKLTAIVVDDAGAPVRGIDVQLRRLTKSGWSSAMRDAETGKDGVAHFPHVQVHGRSSDDGIRWSLRVQAMLTDMLEHEMEPDELPTEPVRFTIHRTGTVTVRVLDAMGEPWVADNTEVTIAAIREGEAREVSPFGSERRATLEATAKDGVAHFPFVGMDLELAVTATRQMSQLSAVAYVPGPTTAESDAKIDVAFGERFPVVTVRVIGSDGTPSVETKLTVQVETDSRMLSDSSRNHVVSDEEGRIRFDINSNVGKDDTRVARIILGDRNSPDAMAMLDLSRSFEPGLHDLGDVRLGLPRVFARGRVVDERGLGVADARLELERRGENESWWNEIWEFNGRSNDDGAFEIYSSYEGEAFRLSAEKSGFAGPAVEFEPGSRNLLLRLSVAGSIAGSVIVDEGIPLDELEAYAVLVDAGTNSWDWAGSDSVNDDGEFEIEDLEAGTYQVKLRVKSGGAELAVVEDVLVVAGQETADPRLSRIDLRGRLSVIKLDIVRPDGKHELQGDYRYGPAGSEELDTYGWFSGTDVTILSTSPIIDINMSPRGFLAVELRDVRGEETVELSTGMSVKIRLVGVDVPEPPMYIHPALGPADADSRSIDWSTPAFDEEREVTVKGVTPGRMRVMWIVERRAGGSAMATMRDSEPEQIIEVLPGVADQVFDVRLNQEELEEILGSLNW